MSFWRCPECGNLNARQRLDCSRCRSSPFERTSAAELARTREFGAELLRASMGRADDELVLSVPPAVGGPAPVWPIPGYRKFSRSSFGGDRPFKSKNPTRYHAGVDIHAPRGTVVVAMEAGTVGAFQGWRSPDVKQRAKMSPEMVEHRTTKALLLALDSGPVIVYGALIPGSWSEFGIGKGSRVVAGQQLGRVGTYPNGDEMLHIEARRPGSSSAKPWYIAEGVPPTLLNVTPLLEAALKSKSAPAPGPVPGELPDLPGLPIPDLPLSRERWIQLALRQLVAPELVVDGILGPASKKAARKFQARAGLDTDGIVGPQTLDALERAIGERAPPFSEATLQKTMARVKDAFNGALKDVFG